MQNDAKKLFMKMATGFVLSRALHTVAQLKLADLFVQGEQSVAQVAQECGLNDDAIYRFLRFLASHEVFTEVSPKVFALTPLAELMVSTNADSMYLWQLLEAEECRWRAYGHMDHSIKTGADAFTHIYGKGFYDYLSDHPDASERFDLGMKSFSTKEDSTIAESFDFSRFSRIADLGGGEGGLLVNILKKYDGTTGMIFDLPHVKPVAEKYIAANNLTDRCQVQAGSFFEEVPRDIDAYIFKRVFHNWGDADVIKILKNVRDAMHNDARILMVDGVVKAGNEPDILKDVDMMMLVLFGGKERTQEEFESMFKQAGLQLVAIHEMPLMVSVLEVKKS